MNKQRYSKSIVSKFVQVVEYIYLKPRINQSINQSPPHRRSLRPHVDPQSLFSSRLLEYQTTHKTPCPWYRHQYGKRKPVLGDLRKDRMRSAKPQSLCKMQRNLLGYCARVEAHFWQQPIRGVTPSPSGNCCPAGKAASK